MYFICLHCQDAKPNGSDDTAEEVWLKKMKLSPNGQPTKFGKYMQQAFDVWQTQAVNDCVSNKN